MTPPAALLWGFLAARLDEAPLAWLRAARDAASSEGFGPQFLLAFGSVPKRLGKGALALSAAELTAAEKARPGFDPGQWTVDQTARALLVLSLPAPDPATLRASLDRLFDDADLGELVALYQALPLLPHPEAHRARAAEGIRANMLPVFEAVASRNPYPGEQLDDAAFNQLVLKCLFVGVPLVRVHGLDARRNPELARNLVDYAHERRAAGRPISPELWRCVGPSATGAVLGDLERALRTGTPEERAAVALSLRANPEGAPLLSRYASEVAEAEAAFPTWERILHL